MKPNDTLVDALRMALKSLERTELELAAYVTALGLLRLGGAYPEGLDQLLKAAREGPPPSILEKYRDIHAAIEELLHKESAGQDLVQLLRNWKPTGPAN